MYNVIWILVFFSFSNIFVVNFLRTNCNDLDPARHSYCQYRKKWKQNVIKTWYKKKLKNSKIHCVKVVLPKKYHIKIAPMTRRIVNGRVFLYKNLELTMDYFVQEKKRNSGLRLITRSPHLKSPWKLRKLISFLYTIGKTQSITGWDSTLRVMNNFPNLGFQSRKSINFRAKLRKHKLYIWNDYFFPNFVPFENIATFCKLKANNNSFSGEQTT